MKRRQAVPIPAGIVSAHRSPACSAEVIEAIPCEVGWAHVQQGIWYLFCRELNRDAVLLREVLRAAGYNDIPRGAIVVCDLERSGELFDVIRVRMIWERAGQ